VEPKQQQHMNAAHPAKEDVPADHQWVPAHITAKGHVMSDAHTWGFATSQNTVTTLISKYS